MALVCTKTAEITADRKRIVFGTMAFDSSYPTGGEAVTVNEMGLASLEHLVCVGTGGYTLQWDGSTSSPLVLAYWVDTTVDGAAQAEVANETDLSGITAAPFIAVGI